MINCFSKHAFAVHLKTKSSNDIVKVLSPIKDHKNQLILDNVLNSSVLSIKCNFKEMLILLTFITSVIIINCNYNIKNLS